MKTILLHVSSIIGLLLVNLLIHQLAVTFNIQVYFNDAFIFGSFANASKMLRIVFTTVMTGVLSLIACYFYTFLPKELHGLKWGMTSFLAGVIGNSLEKLYYGRVWDFIKISLFSLPTYYFNLNDAVQILGLVLIVRNIFKYQDIIWFPPGMSKRSSIMVYRDIQIPFVFKMLGLFLIGSLTQAILTVALLFPKLQTESQDTQLLFILSTFIINLALLPIIGRFFLREFLRSLGPIYALEKFLTDKNSKDKILRFRKTDHFKSLEKKFNDYIKSKDDKADAEE